MGISPQAVLKIRNKLEDLGIIEGYTPLINYQKIGITILVWARIKFLPSTWHEYSEMEIFKIINNHPNIIWACRIPESDSTHILLFGFKDIDQMDNHFIMMQSKLSKIVEIKKIYPFSVQRIVKDTSLGLFINLLDDKDFFISNLFNKCSLLKKK